MRCPHRFWYRTRWSLACIALLFAGCARVNDMGLRLVSTGVDGYMLVNGQLLTGSVILVPDRTGRLYFTGGQGDIKECGGGMRYTASNSGDIELRCDDGTQLSLHYTLLSETRGYGYGSTDKGTASLAFGFSESDARAYLRVPTGKKLVVDSDGKLQMQ